MTPELCIGIFTNPLKPEAVAAAKAAIPVILGSGCVCSIDAQLEGVPGFDAPVFAQRKPDVIAAFGGDGTILRAAAIAVSMGVAVLGVNLGRIGFLSEIAAAELPDAVRAIMAGSCAFDERMMLECRVNGAEPLICLNDVLLYKRSFSGIVDISVEIDGTDAGTVFCDGLIISTPTGATGYSISAGGPVIAPGLDAAIITPVCPHTLCFRPIIAAADAQMAFVVHSDGHISLDGIYAADIGRNDRITVRLSKERARFIRLGERNLYSLIREKLS